MPKKAEKSREEKAAESYFEVDESDVKYATEKQVKKLSPEKPSISIEKNIKQTPTETIKEYLLEPKIKDSYIIMNCTYYIALLKG